MSDTILDEDVLRSPDFWHGVDLTAIINTNNERKTNEPIRRKSAKILCRFLGIAPRRINEHYSMLDVQDVEDFLIKDEEAGERLAWLPPYLPHKSVLSLVGAQIIFENGSKELDGLTDAKIIHQGVRHYVCYQDIESKLWVGRATKQALAQGKNDRNHIGHKVQMFDGPLPIGDWVEMTSRGSLSLKVQYIDSVSIAEEYLEE